MATKTKKVTRKSKVSANESSEQKFKRLAVPRVQAALKRIKLIGNLAGTSYSSTPEQRQKIMQALSAAYASIEEKFNRAEGKKPAEESFTIE